MFAHKDDMKTTRAILALLLALFGIPALAAMPQTAPLLALQLWSVKDEIRRDFDGMLGRIAKAGFQGVEFAGQFGPYRGNPAGLKAVLDKNGLQCAGAHVMLPQLAEQHFVATTDFYRTLGCANLVVSVDPRGATMARSAELASDLAALSAKLATLGMRIGYHNHAPEMFGPVGGTPWDVIAQNTPREMILQQDVGWTLSAGKDPAEYVRRYPGRTITTHFKAKPTADPTSVPIIGKDRADWTELLRAVRETGGTQWIIVEQEDYPDGMGQLESAQASLEGLKASMTLVPDPTSLK